MRSKPFSSMQKTYDECYLVCSTAVYFEGQVSCSLSTQLACITVLTFAALEQRGGSP